MTNPLTQLGGYSLAVFGGFCVALIALGAGLAVFVLWIAPAWGG